MFEALFCFNCIMSLQRTLTCRSLDLGLAMVADQCQTMHTDDLDAKIADSRIIYLVIGREALGCLVVCCNAQLRKRQLGS